MWTTHRETRLRPIRYIGHACKSHFLAYTGVIMVLLYLLSEFANNPSSHFLSLLDWGVKLLSVLLCDNTLR